MAASDVDSSLSTSVKRTTARGSRGEKDEERRAPNPGRARVASVVAFLAAPLLSAGMAGGTKNGERTLTAPLPDPRTVAVPQGKQQRRSEEHTSELQSLRQLVCRPLIEKKKYPQR